MTHALSLGALLFVLWLLLSGHWDNPLLIGFGVISTALCVWLAMRMDVADHEGVPLRMGLRTPMYWPWLTVQILKSNIDVTWRILHPRLPISPTTVRIPIPHRTPLGRAVYANSITLTPGTVAMTIDGDTMLVHALTEENARVLEEGEMSRRVTAFEGNSE
jgi:multicomponent Na+:H+ antiporter subunit E